MTGCVINGMVGRKAMAGFDGNFEAAECPPQLAHPPDTATPLLAHVLHPLAHDGPHESDGAS